MKKVMIFAGAILLILLVWGLIGSSKAAEIGTTCDLGINDRGSVFCWKWHQNILGDFGETVDQIFNK